MTIFAKILPMARKNNRYVAVLAYEGMGAFELGIVTEVFGLNRPEMGSDWYRCQVCALTRGPLRATGGFMVQARGNLSQLAKAGTILIPGWRGAHEPVPKELIAVLRRAHARGARLVSICSGVFVLAATGLLNGKRATTHWRYVDILRSQYPQIRVEPDVLYVDEVTILTSAGSAAGIDLCLHIVRRDFGADIANQVARRLVVPPHRDGGQAQFIQAPIRNGNGGLAPVLDWAQAHLDRVWQVEDLAKKAAMSPRTFARRFRAETGTTPHRWLIHQRLLAAQRRLEKTDDSVDQIAEAVGLQTAATLRLHFARSLHTTPTAYRKRFSLKAN